MVSMWNSMTGVLLAVAVVSSLLLTAAARVVARRYGLLDQPDGSRKSHQSPVPLLGGVSLYLSLLATILVARWIGPEWFTEDAGSRNLTLMLLISGGLFCLVGLWDDHRPLRARTKFLLQIAASLPFVFWCRSIDVIHVAGLELHLGAAGMLFTVFWLVGCANIINLVDGLDGLAATVVLIISVSIAVLAEMQSAPAAVLLSLLLAGSLVGFLFHNWPPARIFLGDSGSLTLGFLIGALSIESSLKTATGFAMAVPLVLISVPIFDTFMAIVRRKLNGKGIGEADREHIHHRLQDRGLTRTKTLLAISGLCLAMASVTLLSAHIQSDMLALGTCAVLLLLLIAGRVFGYNETILCFRYMQAMSQLLIDSSGLLRTRLFLERWKQGRGDQAGDGWEQMTEAVREMGAYRLAFHVIDGNSDEPVTSQVWNSGQEPSLGEAAWNFRYTVPHAAGLQATLEVTGAARNKLKGQRLVDLFLLCDTFCRNWSADLPLFAEPNEKSDPDIITLPARRAA